MRRSSSEGYQPVRRGRTATALLLTAIGLLLVFGVPDGWFPGLAQGADTCGSLATTVCVQPPSQVAETGASLTVEVVADNVTNLGAFQFSLSFEPSVIGFVSGDKAPFLGSTGRNVSCFGPTASGGSVSMSCVTTSPPSTGPPGPDGPNGSGVLATLRFSGLVPGTSALHLTGVIITDVAASPIAASIQDGSVMVVQGPTPTPCPGGTCPTPTPTSTPTPTATPVGGLTVVRVDPPSQTQLEGATFPVSVVVDNAVNLASYQFVLAFDNLRLELVSADNGAFLGSSARPVFCPSPIIGANTVRMACVTAGETPPGPNGSGVLAALSFRAVSGTSPSTATLLDMFDVALSDPLARDIPASVQDGNVTIEKPTPTPCPGGICPTATPALTPSPTPSPTPFPNPCLSGSGVDVCVQPASVSVSAGDGFSVDIVVDDVSNLGGYGLTLSFDPSVVSFNSVTNGPFLGSSGRTASCLTPSVGPNSVTYTCVTEGPTPPGPSGAGILATANFAAQAAGSTALSLQATLSDVTGAHIPDTAHDGVVTVFSGPVPTATITPTPTVGPIVTPTPTPTAQPVTLVWIDPPTQTVAPGATPAVDIRIDNVQNLGSYEWQIVYDPAVLSFQGVVNGSFLGSTGRTVFCLAPILDVGKVRFGCVTSGITPAPPSGSGILSTVTFSALAEGTSALDFNFVSLSDPLGADIPTGSQGGQIVVSAVPPTATTGVRAAVPSGSASGGGGPPMLGLAGALLMGTGLILLAPDLLGAIPRRSRRGKWLDATGEAPEDGISDGVDDDA